MNFRPTAASVALVHRERVLLIRRARAPYHGTWTLPGGRLEAGEDAEAAAAREVREELGLAVHALRPVMRLTVDPARRFRLQVFATEAFEGEITPSDEILEHRWVAEGVLPEPVTPHLPEAIARALRLFDRR
ncbi:MAG TPA: NUDIX domain-containing protein [Alphaproteobacteria bacterium]|nr:NUDIX domain-containing protein [Alphaproteobacteria bacterium]